MSGHAFANILLSGPCNLHCPHCIGLAAGSGEKQNTLDTFPLPGLEKFVERLLEEQITEISLTGIDTEPMLYRHQRKLIEYLREKIPGVKISLHTNGTRILDDPALFNMYDRATISVPSLDPDACLEMTGSARPLDLQSIVSSADIPIKVSILVSEKNVDEIPGLIGYCGEIGIRRVVLRKLYDGTSPDIPVQRWKETGEYGGNPVYDVEGVEVTVWDFSRTQLRCLNLFPDGRIEDSYLLAPKKEDRERKTEFRELPPGIEKASSIGVFLGSFDPPHRGHVWIANDLLEHFEKLLILIPETHFHKTIIPGQNAGLDERLTMITEIWKLAPDRIGIGLTEEVLILRLDQKLQEMFPQATIGFGLGEDLWKRVLDTASYFERSGLEWTQKDERHLELLRARIVVYDRSERREGGISLPPDIAEISSTRVRRTVADLVSSGLDADNWREALDPLVLPGVSERIHETGLYRV